MSPLAPYAKAVVAFVAPGAGILIGAVLPGSIGGEFVTQGELITAVCVSITTAAAVWRIPNKPEDAAPATVPGDGPDHRAI